eukprot:GHVU01206423.1.p1 GENE.GHVU01206423.1~~GHVU01206423.1.p1  ORF type:complete len:140 (-),score=14.69 GHVU01206423.1:186-605(-)
MKVQLKPDATPCKLPARAPGETANNIIQAWAMAGIETEIFTRPTDGTTQWSSPAHLVPRHKAEAIRIPATGSTKTPEKTATRSGCARRMFSEEENLTRPLVFAWAEVEAAPEAQGIKINYANKKSNEVRGRTKKPNGNS